jgi:tetratricopeptide (TPR) repeat protein
MSKVVAKRIAGLSVIVAFLCTGISAQTYNEAANQYNKGVTNFKTNVDSAIIYFENCLKICDQVGDTTFEISSKVVKVLPDLYYQKAFSLLTEKKTEEALAAAKIAMAVSDKYRADATIEKLQKLMVQAYSSMGTKYFGANENEKALAAFDSVLAINPEHTKSIYNKALVYKKMGDNTKFSETIDLYVSKLNPSSDTADLRKANKLAADYFRVAGSKANKANNTTEALDLINKSLTYGTDADSYYQLANIYNKLKNFPVAAENAQKGLDMVPATTTPEDKAKYYYELGVAQAGKGEKDNACETFKNAMFGQFLTAAKGQRTNMKCQ